MLFSLIPEKIFFMNHQQLKDLLEERYRHYNQPGFIASDPVQVPHLFTDKKDIEIAGFLTAVIAWGQRKTIITNAKRLMELMDNAPGDFILHAKGKDMQKFEGFVHRTFNSDDILYFIHALQNIYTHDESLGAFFSKNYHHGLSLKSSIIAFRKVFFDLPHLKRTEKHFANIEKKASAKRINMFLRWMVRKDDRGVDFGIWDIPMSALYIPLDVHSGRVARQLGLLSREQDNWPAVEELTAKLRVFDPYDPVKYDYALFGMGAFEKQKP